MTRAWTAEPPNLEARSSEARLARRRLVLTIICVGLTFLVFRQAAGLSTTDTKLDLVVDPWTFLRRGAVFWNPLVDAGVVQNQAYGYLFPMGPTFGAMFSLGIPAWAAQRLWESVLVCVAFLATQRLARELGVRGFVAQIAAGLAYALAPRMITELTTISSELLPMVALPLMMIPLVQASRSGSARAGALLSGAAFALAGGINAAASLAILPAPALWLLTRERGRRRAILIRWWTLAIGLASAWWVVPLLLLGRYSPPFLDWIESGSVTTAPLSAFNIIRGSTHWVSYLGRTTWPGGWAIAALPAVVAATALVAALALWGLSQRDARHRRYLLLLTVLGTVILSFGHVSTYAPAWAPWMQSLLDGPLAPFRNIHKFDPLVRLPLSIGVGYAVMRLFRLARRRSHVDPQTSRLWRRAITFVLICLAAGYAAPMVTDESAVGARDSANATWWSEAGIWLDAHGGGARSLVVPGSPSPVFLWGKTTDEPLQSSTDSPWTVRSAVPLTPAGYIRYLDLIEQQLATGSPSPDLARLLAVSGIGFVVLRNDLDAYASLATPSEIVRATLAQSPGISRVKTFGPDTTFPGDANNVQNGGMSTPRPAIEIWQVRPAPTEISVVPTANVVSANGASDNLTGPLLDQLGPDAAVLFDPGAHPQPAYGPTLLTDGIRKQQAFFGASTGKSKTLTSQAPYLGERGTYDYLPPGAELSAYEYRGFKDVYATSSGDAIYAATNAGALNGPWSAIDGTPLTAWYSASPFGAIGESLRIDFVGTWSGDHISIQFPPDMLAYPTALDITSEDGTTRVPVLPNDAPQSIAVDIDPTSFLSIQAATLDRANPAGTNFAISDLTLPGLTPQRYLVIPGRSSASYFHFERSPGARDECRTVDERTYCDPAALRFSEEQYAFAREFTLTAPVTVAATVTVALQGSDNLTALLASGSSPTVTTSSTIAPDPRVQGSGVLDDDPSTSWQSAPGDQSPWIELTYAQPFSTDGLTIDVDADDPLARPTTVRVTAGSFTWTGDVPDDGRIDFGEQVSASSVKIEVLDAELRNTTSSFDLRTTLLPAGISHLTISGAPEQPTPSPEVTIPCGSGPTVMLNGVSHSTQITAPRADILRGEQVTATLCDGASLALTAGVNRLRVTGAVYATPTAIDLAPADQPLSQALSSPSEGTAEAVRWGPTDRTVSVSAPVESVLVVRENANDGWQATIDGRRLKPVTVNGWQQGYVLPAGTTGEVDLVFAPAGTVRGALAVGGLLLLVLGGLCLMPHRVPNDLESAGEGGHGRFAETALQVLLVLAGYQLAGTAGLVAGLALTVGWLGLSDRLRASRVALAPVILVLVATGWVVIGSATGLLTRDRELLPSLLVYGALTISCLAAFVRGRRPER